MALRLFHTQARVLLTHDDTAPLEMSSRFIYVYPNNGERGINTVRFSSCPNCGRRYYIELGKTYIALRTVTSCNSIVYRVHNSYVHFNGLYNRHIFLNGFIVLSFVVGLFIYVDYARMAKLSK